MNRREKRILHGLFYARESVRERIDVNGNEIEWLAKHWCIVGRWWVKKDGTYRSIDPHADGGSVVRIFTHAQLRHLKYLDDRGFITYEKTLSDSPLSISVTADGADVARQLHTPFGQLGMWYRDHKDGILGLVITTLVAFATALATDRFVHQQADAPHNSAHQNATPRR